MDRNPDQHDETLLGNDRPRDHTRDELRSDDRDVTARPIREGGALDADDVPGVGDHIGEAAGGISGVLTGAAIGSAGGPVGTLIGGIAGAIGGWWAGHALSEAAQRYTDEDDSYYREQYESSATRASDRTYDDVRPAYQLGHVARLNPDYTGREFEEIEPDLQHGWRGEIRARHGDWTSVRGYAREAYGRGASGGLAALGGAGSAPSAAKPSLAEGGTALGDETAVTGYAGGLTDEDTSRSPSAADRVASELGTAPSGLDAPAARGDDDDVRRDVNR